MRRMRRGGVLFAVIASFAGAAHAALAQPSPEWIRVAVSRNDPQVTLQIHGRFLMLAMHNGSPIHEGRRLSPIAVRGIPQGLVIGDQVLPFSGVRIEPAGGAAIRVNGKRLRGTLEIVRQKDLSLLVINYVALEDYLRGVLSKEAPDYWPEEALKAIAVVGRTYALYQRLIKTGDPYDVSGDVMSQDYGGKSSEKAATTRAVQATAGWILLHDGKLFPTFYHSTCGGITEHGRVMGAFDLPPLRGGVVCRWCTASPFYSWQYRLTSADINWVLRKSRYGTIGSIRNMNVVQRTATGRVDALAIVGAQRTVRLSGYDVRALFGFERVRSALLSVRLAGADTWVLEGHGWGHGVGLCQWGAAELAKRGCSAREILSVYYPQTTLTQLSELANQSIDVIGGAR